MLQRRLNLAIPLLYLISLREEGVLEKWAWDDSVGLHPSSAHSSHCNPSRCFYDYLNVLYDDLCPSYLRHVEVRRVLYNSWWHSKKVSLTSTSTILEFPVCRMEFGRVLPHQSGHLDVMVCSSAPKGVPFQESPSFQSAVGFEVHSFTVGSLPTQRPALNPGVHNLQSGVRWYR